MADLFANHRRFAGLDDGHREADELRAEGVIHCVDRTEEDCPPFRAVLGLEEVVAVERQPNLFADEPLAVLSRRADIAARCQRSASCATVTPPASPLPGLAGAGARPASTAAISSAKRASAALAPARLSAARTVS